MRKKYAQKLDFTAFLKMVRETPYSKSTQPIYFNEQINGYEIFLIVERHENVEESLGAYINEYLVKFYYMKPEDKISLKNCKFAFELKFYDGTIIDHLFTCETLYEFFLKLEKFVLQFNELQQNIWLMT